jgi:hypothetical protein
MLWKIFSLVLITIIINLSLEYKCIHDEINHPSKIINQEDNFIRRRSMDEKYKFIKFINIYDKRITLDLKKLIEECTDFISLHTIIKNHVYLKTKKCNPLYEGDDFDNYEYHIDDGDILVFYNITNEYCTNNTLAYEVTCYRDQYGRPISAYINFCSYDDFFMYSYEEKKNILLHELSHALGFDKESFENYFSDIFDKYFYGFMQNGCLWHNYRNYQKVYMFIGKNSVNYIREFFDCTKLNGVELIGAGGNHLSDRFYHQELMTSFLDSESGVEKFWNSNLFKYIMESSGWYEFQGDFKDTMYGKNEGCSFFESCDKHWLKYGKKSCYGFDTSNSLIFQYDNPLPKAFRYFTNPYFGGYPTMDYCPIRKNYWVENNQQLYSSSATRKHGQSLLYRFMDFINDIFITIKFFYKMLFII